MAGVSAEGSRGCHGSVGAALTLRALLASMGLIELEGSFIHHFDIIQLGLQLAANIG